MTDWQRVARVRRAIMRMSVTEVARMVADSVRTAKRVRVWADEDHAIGHDECGGCGATVRPRDRYCWRCGSRLYGCRQRGTTIGTVVFDEWGDE